jgi:hypothetical protein
VKELFDQMMARQGRMREWTQELNQGESPQALTDLGILLAAAILRASGMAPERAVSEAKCLEIFIRTPPPERDDERAF